MARIKVSENAQGTIYWDNVEKRSIFVARDQEPDFEFEENPETMIHVPVDLKVTLDGKAVVDALANGTVEQTAQQPDKQPDDDISLLSVKQLRDIAKEKELDVPGNASKDVLVAAIVASDKDDDDMNMDWMVDNTAGDVK